MAYYPSILGQAAVYSSFLAIRSIVAGSVEMCQFSVNQRNWMLKTGCIVMKFFRLL